MPGPNFSICIPTWNSLPYLKLCINSIRENSSFGHPIIVHDNASTDGTKEWLEDNKVMHTWTKTNEGFCAVNHALRKVVASSHAMIFNSDMYALPQWDQPIVQTQFYFQRHGIKNYTISSCLIEPTGANPEYDIDDCGSDAESFDEKKLLASYVQKRSRYLARKDTVQYSHPILLPVAMLKQIGYMDIEYFPGWASDHDLAARAYFRGDCRHFVMLGGSRVYHFSSKTFKQLPDEIRGRHCEDLFLNKWGMSVRAFRQKIGVTNRYEKSFA